MSISLFSRPGSVALVDDDPDFLAMLRPSLTQSWKCSFFTDAHEFLHYLEIEAPFFEADVWAQQQVVHRWIGGEPLVPGILSYWAKFTERFALTRVCVVDRQMPMDGFEVLDQLRCWHGQRLLLTGHVYDAEAVVAFNAGLIDKFVAKQSPSLGQSLNAAIATLQYKAMQRIDQIWRGTLSPAQNGILSDLPVARELASWAREKFVEHVVIGCPFGVLGVEQAGGLGWIQIILDREQPSSEVTDADIRAEFSMRETSQPTLVRCLGANGTRAAYFPLPWIPDARRDRTYQGWLQRQRQSATLFR
jgi:CheY-like chemotaxis protein